MKKLVIIKSRNRTLLIVFVSVLPVIISLMMGSVLGVTLFYQPENSEISLTVNEKLLSLLLFSPFILGLPIGHVWASRSAMAALENHSAGPIRKRTVIGYWIGKDTVAHGYLFLLFSIIAIPLLVFTNTGLPPVAGFAASLLIYYVYMAIGQPLIWIFITLPVAITSALLFRLICMRKVPVSNNELNIRQSLEKRPKISN